MYKIGDIVEIFANDFSNERIKVGSIGVIKSLEVSGYLGVEFDKNISGHDLEGRCPDGKGWYIPREKIRFYKPNSWKKRIEGLK